MPGASTFKKILTGGKTFGKGLLQENVEEVIAGISNNILVQNALLKRDVNVFEGVDLDLIANTTVVSAVMLGQGFGANTRNAFLELTTNVEEASRFQSLTRKLIDLQSSNSTDKRKQTKETLQQLGLENMVSLSKLNTMTPQELQDLGNIQTQINKLNREASQFGVSMSQKGEITAADRNTLKKMEGQFEVLRSRKNDLLKTQRGGLAAVEAKEKSSGEQQINNPRFNFYSNSYNAFKVLTEGMMPKGGNYIEFEKAEDLNFTEEQKQTFLENYNSNRKANKAKNFEEAIGRNNAWQDGNNIYVNLNTIYQQIAMGNNNSASFAAASPLHELSHIRNSNLKLNERLVKKAVDDAIDIIKANEDNLNKKDYKSILDRLEIYKKRGDDDVRYEEFMQVLSDAQATGLINLSDYIDINSFKDLIKYAGAKAFGDLSDIFFKIETPNDVFNYINSYQTVVKKGTLIGSSDKEEETIKTSEAPPQTLLEKLNTMIPANIKTKEQFDEWIRDSKNYGEKEVAIMNSYVNSLVRDKKLTKEQADIIIDELPFRVLNFDPAATRADNTVVGPQGFGERIFSDVKFAKRTANKALFEASEKKSRESKREDREDGFETLIAPETEIEVVTQSKPSTRQLELKNKLLSNNSKNLLEEIVEENISDLIPEDLTFKNLPNYALQAFANEIGIPVKKFDPNANFTQNELEKLLNYIEEKVNTIRIALPEASIPENSAVDESLIGTATGVPNNILRNPNLYTRQERTTKKAGIIPYLKKAGINNSSILKAVGIINGKRTAGPRDKAAQTAKGIIIVVAKTASNQEARKRLIENPLPGQTPTNILNLRQGIKSNILLSEEQDKKIFKKYGGKSTDFYKLNLKTLNKQYYKSIRLFIEELGPIGPIGGSWLMPSDIISRDNLKNLEKEIQDKFKDRIATVKTSANVLPKGFTGFKPFQKWVGKTEEAIRNNLPSIFKESKIYSELFENITVGLVNVLRKDNGLNHFPAISHMFRKTNNEAKTLFRLAAPFTMFETDVSTIEYKDPNKPWLKKGYPTTYVFEHAVQVEEFKKLYFDYILKAAQDPEMTEQAIREGLRVLKKKYEVAALGVINNDKVTLAGYQNKMPVGWKYLWQRYFNPKVANQRGGIAPTKIQVIKHGETAATIEGNATEVLGVKDAKGTLNELGKSLFKLSESQDQAANKNNKELPKKFQLPKGSTNEQVLAKMQALDDQANKARLGNGEIQIFHGGSIKSIEGIKGFAYFSENKNQAKKYSEDNNGKVQSFVIKENDIFSEEVIYNEIKKLKLKPKVAGWKVSELNVYELIDPRFETSLSEKDLNKLAQALANKNIKAVRFLDMNLNSLKNDIYNIVVIDKKIIKKGDEATIKFSKSQDLNEDFNNIIEAKTGIETYKRFSPAKAAVRGASKGKFNFFIPPSAEDFIGLLYKTLAKGKLGDRQMQWYKDNLLDPYARAMNDISAARVAMFEDYKALKNDLEIIPKDLKKKSVDEYTREQAVRVYIWNDQDNSIPGLFKTDRKDLVDYVNKDSELKLFAEQLIAIQKNDEYSAPKEGWLVGNITTDLLDSVNSIKRKKYLEQWQTNVDMIFSEENINKLEATFGKPYVKALENILQRMKTGRNKPFTSDSLAGRVTDWLNNSVGAIMFFNTRSAVLQTLSSINFVNWSDNNIYQAGKALANQPQYWKDFKFLFNSDFLKERRGGLRFNVAESEIADAAKKGGVRGVISKILQAGFLPTQMADSFAIASGGATFYRNRVKSYIKEGLTETEAQEKAFLDFREIAEESQQSSRPDRISAQQAGPLGRTILAFANTPAQYARLTKKAASDLINRRGDAKTNISKLLYYGFVQNLIFNMLQKATFLIAFGDEDEDEKKKEKAYLSTINGMADGLLRGMGVQGAIASTLKNTLIRIIKESEKSRPDYAETAVIQLLGISPPIQSKAQKVRSALKSYEWNKNEMLEKGFSLDNPAYMAGANIISAGFNVPLDRVVKKVSNIAASTQEDISPLERSMLIAGWSEWELGIQKPKPKKKKKTRSSGRGTSRSNSRSSNRR